jgi:hypothetical protein
MMQLALRKKAEMKKKAPCRSTTLEQQQCTIVVEFFEQSLSVQPMNVELA